MRDRHDLRAEELGEHAGNALGVMGRNGEVVDSHGRFSFFFVAAFDRRFVGFVGFFAFVGFVRRSLRGVSRAALTAWTRTSIAHAAA